MAANGSSCLSCGGPVDLLVDFGMQPPSNRFEQQATEQPERHRLQLGQCNGCALLQLIDPMPPAMAKSRFEWLTYNEPEGHLDRLVERLRALPGIDAGARIAGLTYKDDTTLARFNRLGFADTYRYDTARDLGLDDPCASLESIQAAVDEPTAARLAARHGRADLLLVRHVIEHAHDPLRFLEAVSALVKPGGYLLFEMPDCGKFIRACDYPFVWEEHITYFNASTLAALIRNAGLEQVATVVDPYPLEDSLIAIVRNAPAGAGTAAPPNRDALLGDGRAFAHNHGAVCASVRAKLEAWKAAGHRTAIFGAGHIAAKFVNFHGVADLLDCTIDDKPEKQQVLMPGSRLPIVGSAALASRGIDRCLLSLSPESEQKVLAKNGDFTGRGGRFASIFALSPMSIRNPERP
ncbi:MAG: class I SAM-dependent methyltransferase [bacterium]|jgi:SAM-dependent methyltransferase|nr:class I SAM-dependent methyltransferase [Betaproteobacteria bacterium]